MHVGDANWTIRNVPTGVNIQYMFMQILFHETARWQNTLKKNSLSKCNQMQCMRIKWNMHDKLALVNTEQADPLNLCTKAHWNSFHYDWGSTEKHGEKDRQRKRSIMISDYRGRKSLASYTGISLQSIVQSLCWKKEHTKKWAFSHFIYKWYCLPQCHSVWYILHMETC